MVSEYEYFCIRANDVDDIGIGDETLPRVSLSTMSVQYWGTNVANKV